MTAPDTFVGRKAELAALHRALDRALAGDCTSVLVVGEAGIGKSRLVDRFVRTTASTNTAGTPDSATTADTDSTAGSTGPARPAVALTVVRGWATDESVAPTSLWTGVQRALGVSRDHLDPTLPVAERRWEVLELLASELAMATPALVVLEDLHWADESSLWVLDRLPQELPPGSPVLLLGTARRDPAASEVLERVRRHCEVVELRGLDAADVGTLLQALAVDDAPDPATLVARTGGNPLFLRELVALGLGADRVPPVVSSVLQRSLDRLDDQVRAAVDALALAGASPSLAVLAAALDTTVDDVLASLERAAALDVVALGPAGRVSFRHDLLGQAARTAIPPKRRSSLHTRLATAWRVMDPSPAGRAQAAAQAVAALPAGDPAAVAGEVLDALCELRRTGGDLQAVGLAAAAEDALAVAGTTLDEKRARIAVEHARALVATGDDIGGRDTFARAADLARDVDDPTLRAVAEAGAAQRANPFIPQVERLRRLAEVEAALPGGDAAERVALLGRMCVLRSSSPEELPEAHAYGDEAVAVARRLGDPDLLVAALADRHFVPAGAAGLDERARAADELIELGRRRARPDVALQGYEWRFGDCVDRADRAGAGAALDHLVALAQVMPSPSWWWAARPRQTMLHVLDGARDAALALADDIAAAAAAGAGAGAEGTTTATVTPPAVGATAAASAGPERAGRRLPTLPWEESEQVGIELAMRTSVALVWGVRDDALIPLYERAAEMLARFPVPFVQISLALAGLAAGDLDRARAAVDRYAPHPEPLLQSLEGTALAASLGTLAATTEAIEHRHALVRVLGPLQHRLGVGSGNGFVRPVAVTLGHLALLDGDHEAALAHLEPAVARFRRMPSPTLLAEANVYLAEARARAGDRAGARTARDEARQIADRLGQVLPEVSGAGTNSAAFPETSRVAATRGADGSGPAGCGSEGPQQATLHRTGRGWRLVSPYGTATLAGSRGLEHLARILQAPSGTEVASTELAGMDESPVPVARDLGPALDARAKREYRSRVRELQADIDEAEDGNDLERAARARLELDALLTELRRAVGLGSRDRPIGSGAERARVNVTRNLRRALDAIADQAPGLGAHLERSLRTGRHCSYSPEPQSALAWHVDV